MRKPVQDSTQNFSESNDEKKSDCITFSHSPYSYVHVDCEPVPEEEGQQFPLPCGEEALMLSSSKPSEHLAYRMPSAQTSLLNYLPGDDNPVLFHQNSSLYSPVVPGSRGGIVEGGSFPPFESPETYQMDHSSSPSPRLQNSIVFSDGSQGAHTLSNAGKSSSGIFLRPSYTPASFSLPEPSSWCQSQYSNGFCTEPFTVSPSMVPRASINQLIGSMLSPPKSNRVEQHRRSASPSAFISNESNMLENLSLCPEDEECTLINEKKHQRKFLHTCRLFPCYHGHIHNHAKLFLHAADQIVFPEGMKTKQPSHVLPSAPFSNISPDAPNAYRIFLEHQNTKHELFGSWENVKVHTFKRYLHQLCSISPATQCLYNSASAEVMDDDLRSVKSYEVVEDSLIFLKSKDEEDVELLVGVLDGL